MGASVQGKAGCRVVRVYGELDLLTAAEFGSRLERTGRTAVPDRLIVDLSGVTFMDCFPLRHLCAAAVRTELAGGWTRLVYGQRQIGILLRSTRLSPHFPRYATTRDARRGVASDTPR